MRPNARYNRFPNLTEGQAILVLNQERARLFSDAARMAYDQPTNVSGTVFLQENAAMFAALARPPE